MGYETVLSQQAHSEAATVGGAGENSSCINTQYRIHSDVTRHIWFVEWESDRLPFETVLLDCVVPLVNVLSFLGRCRSTETRTLTTIISFCFLSAGTHIRLLPWSVLHEDIAYLITLDI